MFLAWDINPMKLTVPSISMRKTTLSGLTKGCVVTPKISPVQQGELKEPLWQSPLVGRNFWETGDPVLHPSLSIRDISLLSVSVWGNMFHKPISVRQRTLWALTIARVRLSCLIFFEQVCSYFIRIVYLLWSKLHPCPAWGSFLDQDLGWEE